MVRVPVSLRQFGAEVIKVLEHGNRRSTGRTRREAIGRVALIDAAQGDYRDPDRLARLAQAIKAGWFAIGGLRGREEYRAEYCEIGAVALGRTHVFERVAGHSDQ